MQLLYLTHLLWLYLSHLTYIVQGHVEVMLHWGVLLLVLPARDSLFTSCYVSLANVLPL
jgi:hypothetical protein